MATAFAFSGNSEVFADLPIVMLTDALLVHIKAIHAEAKDEYGWPRIWKELLAKGLRVGKERVRKLMALHGIKARAKKKYKATTDSNHGLPVAPNLLGAVHG